MIKCNSIGGGVDAKSAEGNQMAFSKANRNALMMANSSLFYEFASNEILNSLSNIHRRKRQTFDQNALFGVFRDDFVNSLQNIDVNTLLSGSISPVSLEPQCVSVGAELIFNQFSCECVCVLNYCNFEYFFFL